VIITGGILGIVAMRLVIGQLLRIVRRYPALVDGAFIIIGWVAIKLLVEFLNSAGYIELHISKWLSFGLIVVIFAIAYFYARKKGPVEEADEDAATRLLEKVEKEGN
jgi:predicted tellurium resistance membrane protein TerC